jgi:hypothetical protein
LIYGTLESRSGEPLEVRGRVGGHREALDADRFVKATPLAFLGTRRFLGPWGTLFLTDRWRTAKVEFAGEAWRSVGLALRVVDMHPSPVGWLRAYLDHASSWLAAQGSFVPSAEAAWKVARLHLVFKELPQATRAVRSGLEYVRGLGLDEVDPDDLQLLDTQLRWYGCFDVADELRAYLDGLPG